MARPHSDTLFTRRMGSAGACALGVHGALLLALTGFFSHQMKPVQWLDTSALHIQMVEQPHLSKPLSNHAPQTPQKKAEAATARTPQHPTTARAEHAVLNSDAPSTFAQNAAPSAAAAQQTATAQGAQSSAASTSSGRESNATPAATSSSPVSYTADYLNNPRPAYPAVSRQLGEQGSLTLRVLVDDQGKSKVIELNKGSGFERLDKAALAAVGQWRFKPAMQGDKAIEAWVLIPIHFSLKGAST